MKGKNEQQNVPQGIFAKALLLILFVGIYDLVQLTAVFTALVQYVLQVSGRGPLPRLQQLGGTLSVYAGQVVEFLTYREKYVPFPFGTWPKQNLEEQPGEPAGPAAGEAQGGKPSEPAKGAAKSAASGAASSAAKSAASSATKSTAKSSAKSTAGGAPKKSTAKSTGKSTAKSTAKSAGKGAPKKSAGKKPAGGAAGKEAE
ncbi:MAG: DUF4389 domain-containing protein [Deltaproteobacteria bacterium]|nr:DUF4389 domain-containing protein [Deltaproteobacteria bacterium]